MHRQAAADPGVVDQHVQPRLGLYGSGCGGDAGIVGHIHLNEARPQRLCGGPAALLVAGGDPHVMPIGQQPPCGLKTQSLVCTCNQCGCHGIHPASARRPAQWAAASWDCRDHPAPWNLRDHVGMPVITKQLAGCLRSWRERVSPADVGLSAGGQRRVSGLRREEVAQLAGVSMDYLIRLEQGRAANPSAAVLGALARALRLSDDEHSHLLDLAGQPLPGP